MKTISYDDYLRLTGLLTLAADHRKAIGDIHRSVMHLLAEEDELGHAGDAVWGGYEYTAAELLTKLGYAVPTPPAREEP